MLLGGVVMPETAALTTTTLIVTATATVVTAVTTLIPSITTLAAISAVVAISVGTRTTGRLDIAFRFGLESPHGKPHLTGLLVNLEQLDINFLADRENILDILSLVPGDLGDMEKAFLSREDLDESSELKY